jgi:phosphoribosylformylglycinamidine cyclo-ligase
MCYRKGLVKIISHITGGGIVSNTKRVIPDNLKISIYWDSWKIPAIFRLIQKTGKIDDKEMRRVFNLGIGLVMICSGDNVTKVQKILKSINEKYYIIGEIY